MRRRSVVELVYCFSVVGLSFSYYLMVGRRFAVFVFVGESVESFSFSSLYFMYVVVVVFVLFFFVGCGVLLFRKRRR